MNISALLALISCGPTVLRYLGFMAPQTVALNAQGKTWNSVSDAGTEPIYTKQKPNDEAFYFSAAALVLAFTQPFNKSR